MKYEEIHRKASSHVILEEKNHLVIFLCLNVGTARVS